MMVGFVHTPGFVRAVEVVGGCGRTVAHEVPARSLRWSDRLGCAGASSVALAAASEASCWTAVGDVVPEQLGLFQQSATRQPESTTAVAASIAERSTGVSFRLGWEIVLVTAYHRIRGCCREGGTRSAPDGKDEPWTRGCWLS